ncbi:MAG TPA: hypothetical protein VNO70_13580 [Blastocatellia bacterium]|nr:hypothetical protein [Blastocatellia bacterium]
MKNLVNRTVALLVMGAIASVLALAKPTTKEVTFSRDVMVNGTVVKAGTYKVVFDDQTGELTITKGKKTVAQAPARLEKLEGDSRAVYTTRTETDGDVLLSVTLKDGNRAVIGNGGNSEGGRAQ